MSMPDAALPEDTIPKKHPENHIKESQKIGEEKWADPFAKMIPH